MARGVWYYNNMAFYTYLWLREDGTPYYVGKGSGHRAFRSDGHGVLRPKSRQMIIVQEWPSEKDAFAAEMFLIAYYGRKDLGTGCLRNRTDGGEGTSGISDEERQSRRIRMLGTQLHRGYVHSSESRAAMRKSHLGVPLSKEHVANARLVNSNRTKRLDRSSRYLGVCWKRDKKKWHARVKVFGRLIHVGYFIIEEDAAIARDAYVVQHKLPYRLNFIGETYAATA
jgi:hypothetical protein